MDGVVERVILWLLKQPPSPPLRLGEGRSEPTVGLDDGQLDDALREAKARSFLTGERTDYGSAITWNRIRLTAAGLRFSRQWPPVGREHHHGPWEAGHWGSQARPVLQKLKAGVYRHEFLPGLDSGTSDERYWEILSAHELLADGYLTANQQDHMSLSDMRLTQSGRDALDPQPRDAIDEARQRLRTSSTEAVIHAIEVGLGERLRKLGAEHDLVPTDPNVHQALSRLNDQLTGTGRQLYAKPWKKLIEALLDVRNEYAHGRGSRLPDTAAGWAIDTVEMVLGALPVPSDTTAV